MSKKIEITVLTKRRHERTLNVPSAMVVCPCCEGRSASLGGCELCAGKNVVEVADQAILSKYPRIMKAWDRFDAAEQADAWERYGERMMRC